MGINEIIMYIMMFFMLIAAVDRILSQFGGSARFLGKFGKSIEGSGGQFEEGFMAMGALGLAMVGMTALAPVLAHVLGPVIIPLYEMLGANPSMFAGTLLACDMGGFFLFGLSLVLFSSGMELFGEKIVATWLALSVILGGILLFLLYIRHARRHPTPLISLGLFNTRTFSVGIAGNIASRLGTGCVPFLMPLMLQVGFGYPALIAGCMMAPTAMGSILAKSTVTQVLRWCGYRKTLVGVTVFIGLMIAQFSLQSAALPVWMLILPLFVLGMAMSTQFTSMNTITLADLTDENASSGNSVLAVTQQLSISLGVAVSAAVLRFYEGFDSANTVEQFHYTFITMGALTVVSALVFMLLKPKDGRNLIKERHKEKAKPNRVPSEQE